MKIIITSFFIVQLILCFSKYASAVPNTKFLDVSVNVYEKCTITRPEAFDHDSFPGVTVNCEVDTPYIKVDGFNAQEFIEKDFYDSFSPQFHPQLYIENEYCKMWCNATTDQFPPQESNGDIIKMTVLW